MVWFAIGAKEDQREMSRKAADTGFRVGNSRKMQSADCRQDLRVGVEEVELGRHHSLL